MKIIDASAHNLISSENEFVDIYSYIEKYKGQVLLRYRCIDCYYLDGKIHNDSGPAKIYYFSPDKVRTVSKLYYWHGHMLPYEKWFEGLPKKKQIELLFKLDK